jgi:hypothetical protein
MMMFTNLRLRRINLTTAVSLLAQLSVIALVIWAVVVATHSDDHLPELFRKLTPAGNCLCETSTTFDCKWTQDHHKNNKAPDTETTSTTEADWQFQHGRDDRDFGMSEYKCNAAFPGLFEEVHRAVAWRAEQKKNVTLGELDSIKIERGRVRVLIADGHIRILEASHSYDDQRKRALAILYSLHRAISADPKAIPNVEFILSADDMVDTPSQPIWAITRRAQDQNLWVMPDFGFWSWDIEDIGSMDELAAQVIRDEDGKSWDHKIPQLVWRGTTTMLPKLRLALLDASKGKSWSNVAALTPAAHPENYVSAAEQCRFMYLAHAEGTYIVHEPGLSNIRLVPNVPYRSKLLWSSKVSTALPIGYSHPQTAVDSALPLPLNREWHGAELC